jgi:MFS family permease
VFPLPPEAGNPDTIAHIIQVALAPAFLLSALATLLNVFSTRLGRVADKVDKLRADLIGAGPDEAAELSRRLAHLRRRSLLLDLAVILASLGGVLTGIAVLTLFVGALREGSAASVLFVCFGLALGCTIGAILAFLGEILLAGRGVRIAAGSSGHLRR